jgi:hypothetical protein
MGSEATIRYLKARLVVMEEELSEAGAVAREREERLTELEQRNKELEEDKVCMHADTHARAPGLDVLCAWVCACTRRASLRNAPRARDWSADLHATVAMSAHNSRLSLPISRSLCRPNQPRTRTRSR